MKSAIALSALTVLLAACANTPIEVAQASQIPKDRILAPELLVGQQQTSKASVSFTRDAGGFGGGCTHFVYVNNRRVFDINQGEAITIYLEPGAYFFRLEVDGGGFGGLCPSNLTTSQNATLQTGEAQTYRIAVAPGTINLARTR